SCGGTGELPRAAPCGMSMTGETPEAQPEEAQRMPAERQSFSPPPSPHIKVSEPSLQQSGALVY
ncbi:hypothetical protein LD39_06350, partial [Halobacillus sp. BBL2006]